MKPLSGSRSSLVKDGLLYAFCGAGILLSLNFFRLDLFRTMTRLAEQPVGTITFKYRAAQRRFADRVLWDRLRRESPVYEGDFVRTADLAEATITFAGGTVIDLEENSLIRIHGNNRIGIDRGSLAAHAGNEFVLVCGDNLAAVGAGGVVRAGAEGGDLMLRVMEGTASFTGRGESGTAPAGEAFVLGEAGPRALQKVSPLYPRPQARLLNPRPEKLEAAFRWSRVNLGVEETVRLEVATDRAFKRSVFSGDVATDGTTVELEPGSYFWRVLPPDGSGAFPAGEPAGSPLDVSAFRVIAAPAPVLITPAEGYNYRFRLKRPEVRFQWTVLSGAASYILEAADNPQMTDPALLREVRGTSLYSPELGPGTWYWRVRPVFPASWEGSAGEVLPASFRIIQSGTLGPPEPRIPQDRSIVNIAAGDLYFSWRPEAEAGSYTVVVSADPDMRNPALTETVRDNFYSCRAGRNIIGPGRYYWTVFQTDTEGNNSAPSPVRSFTALEGEIVQRLVFPPEGYTAAAVMLPDMRFTWKTSLLSRTRFQISAEPGFSSLIVDEAVSGETFQGRIVPEGTWYWRVRTEENGAVFETPARSFTAAPPIPAPPLVAPGPEGRVTVREEGQPAFSWGAAEGAEYYQLALYHEENRSPVYQHNFIEGTEYSLSLARYPEGNYRWTVQGFAPESSRNTRRTGLLSEGSFIARKLRPVSLDYPGNGAAIGGLDAYREPETARWSSGDEVGTSRFIISSRQDLSGPPAAVIHNPPARIRMPPLRPGDYYWTIQAESFDGFDISAGTPHLLRVLPIPLLPAAENRLPQDGRVINGTELKENRNIVFSWNAVPGASGYIFSLENEDTKEIVIRKGPLAETAFTLENLDILDAGAFVWRVEAVLAEPAGERREEEEIIQRGEPGENRLGLAFNLPGAPELQRPGVLYGREAGNEKQ
ncbi:MAG: FecR family protein [Treponema sp.]|nr:FecR family protein [Treponema sp.]